MSTLLVDGERYPAAAYGNRTLHVVLQVAGTDDEVAAELQRLHRELDRPTGLLRYRPGTSEPVFFRTFRSGPGSVVWNPFTKEVAASIPADPFAYGLRVDLPVWSAVADPATGMYLDVADVQGDVETPLFLRVDNGVIDTGRRMSAIGVRRWGDPAAVPYVLQAESMSPSASTTVQPNDPAMSGAGSNYQRCTFGISGMTTRLSATHPATPSPEVRGTYRVWCRARKTVAADTIQMRLTVSLDGATVTGDTVTLPTGIVPRWVDLGLVQYPMGPDPATDGYSGTPLAVRGQTLLLEAARLLGTGNLDIDALAFVPADDRLCLIKWSAFSGPIHFVVDSAADRVYGVGASGEVRASELVEVAGGYPMVSPGVTNRLHWIWDVGSTSAPGAGLTISVDVNPYYWPRYLYVRPVAS